MDEIDQLLQSFYSELILIEGMSELTAETYSLSVKFFLEYIKNKKLNLQQLTEKDIVAYFIDRKESGIDEITIAKDMSSLRSFGSFLTRNNIWVENIFYELEKPKISKKLPKVLSVDDVDKLLDVIDTSKPLGIRDRALYELIYSCGLRISEASGLLLTNVHFDEQIIIVCGKGNKERMIPFGSVAKEWLIKWIYEVRPGIVGQRPVNEVFVNSKGNPLSRKGIWKNFQTLEEKSGVEAKVHTLRHSFASHLLAGGADLRSVQVLLGHADLSTTTIYTHIEDEMLENYHSGYFPGHKESSGD